MQSQEHKKEQGEGSMAGGGVEGETLEYTPTWVVVVVFTVIVAISVAVERLLHFTGKNLRKKNRKSLFQALFKIKEELLLLGFISLLLTVFQDVTSKICIPKHITNHLLPCKETKDVSTSNGVTKSTAHFLEASSFGRHLLAESAAAGGYCDAKGKAPLLSPEAMHDLHIFIFVLTVSHVLFSALTILLGGLKLKQWKHWEDSIQREAYYLDDVRIINVRDHDFIRARFSCSVGVALISWMKSFFKHFYGSVKRTDYTTLRLGFITVHCHGNPNFNFHKYMMRTFEHDFKKVVGIRWYLWVFVIVYLLLNVDGWNAYFWFSFIPLILLLAVGAKLEHIQSQLAEQIAEKHIAIEGELMVRPSDEHFWFDRPRLLLHLIHIILFQNSFEIAVFFWMLITFGINSCIMGQVGFIVPRIFIWVLVQFICCYNTLPLYIVVTQMGHSFNKAIFEDDIQAGLVRWGLVRWANRAKKEARKVSYHSRARSPSPSNLHRLDSVMERGEALEIQPAAQDDRGKASF